ncbi:DUF2461 domain-containing protein [bacterium]|nr:DUF2461 domain-containing protein [bacterium]
MAYFSNQFNTFFKGLAANNNKEYFDEHRKIYEKEVKKPFQELLRDLAQELSVYDKEIGNLQIKNAVFRINRDIRFSKDKTPYNLHVSAVVSPHGRKDMQHPGLYVMLSPDTCHFGGGMYMPDKDNLEKIRQHIVNHPKAIEALIKDKEFNKVYGGLKEGETNKILPKQFKEYGDTQPLLFNKQFYFMAEYPGEKTVIREDLLPFIAEHYRVAEPWNKWFKSALGIG